MGELVEEAVVREVLEETGVTVRPEKLLYVLDSINRDDDGRCRFHYVLFEYLCRYVSGETVAGSDAPDVRWVPLDDLESVDIMPSTLRFVRKVVAEEHLA